MRNKKGFSLLSFLLYLMCFTMIMLFSCHIVVLFVIPSFSAMHKCQSIIASHIATDLFVRDIREIVPNQCHWKLITPHELIWEINERNIGWRFSNNCLERIEGVYNQGWKHKTTSIIATGIKQATFTVKKHDGEIIGIELIITPIVQTKPIVCSVAIRKEKKI